jgi:hypothetical protein
MKPGSPGRFFFRLRVHRGRKGERRSMSEAGYAALVTAAHRTLGAPVILTWDNLNTHRSTARRKLATAQATRPHPATARPHHGIPRPDRPHA